MSISCKKSFINGLDTRILIWYCSHRKAWESIMHLNYSTSEYKGQTYKSYSIAESYREGKKVRKRVIWRIGKLTEQQAQQIKLIL